MVRIHVGQPNFLLQKFYVRTFVKIRGLFISPGHNFFGHKNGAPGEHALLPRDEIFCVAGRGIQGDRFFNFKNDYKGQITFFAQEIFDDVCRELNVKEKSPGVTRRNVVTHGADLNSFIGKEFEMQGVRFAGVCECSPCFWMNEAIAPGAKDFLRGRGGLRAKIVSDGILRVEN